MRLLLINPRSGSGHGHSADGLRAEAERRGVQARVLGTLEPPVEIAIEPGALRVLLPRPPLG